MLVIAMVGIGGATRLTKSGLSITEWKPILGIIPPITHKEWEEEFNKYKKIPEFSTLGKNFSLIDFKKIFYLEYFHRLFGRIIFLFTIIPLIYFFLRKKISTTQFIRLLGIFALIGVQGLIGWYMVKSGLKYRTNVNEFWLAFHLCFALLIFTLIFYEGLKIKFQNLEKNQEKSSIILFITTFIILPIQIFFGGLVAGSHILHFCNNNTHEICSFKFLDVVIYQDTMPYFWAHKLLGIISLFAILITCFSILKYRKKLSALILAATLLQIGLGISVIFIQSTSIWTNYLAVFHQVNGFFIYGTMIYAIVSNKYQI